MSEKKLPLDAKITFDEHKRFATLVYSVYISGQGETVKKTVEEKIYPDCFPCLDEEYRGKFWLDDTLAVDCFNEVDCLILFKKVCQAFVIVQRTHFDMLEELLDVLDEGDSKKALKILQQGYASKTFLEARRVKRAKELMAPFEKLRAERMVELQKAVEAFGGAVSFKDK